MPGNNLMSRTTSCKRYTRKRRPIEHREHSWHSLCFQESYPSITRGRAIQTAPRVWSFVLFVYSAFSCAGARAEETYAAEMARLGITEATLSELAGEMSDRVF